MALRKDEGGCCDFSKPLQIYKDNKAFLSLWNSLLQRVYDHITFHRKYEFNSDLVEFWRDYATRPPLIVVYVCDCALCAVNIPHPP